MKEENLLATPIVKEIRLAATPHEVWLTLTDKEEMRKWYFDFKDFRPEPGFHFSFYGEKDGEKFLHHCTVTEAVPDKKIAYTWKYEQWPGESLVSFELGVDGDYTLLRLTHSGLESFPQNEMLKKSNFEEGWTAIIDGALARHFEKKKK